jgi:ABC-type transporter Mla MlaB component
VPKSERFSHDEACRVCRDAMNDPDTQTVVIDLRHAMEVTTAAFARLVLLRRRLRAKGRDLRLANLRGRAANLYEVNRLNTVLPRLAEATPRRHSSAEAH